MKASRYCGGDTKNIEKSTKQGIEKFRLDRLFYLAMLTS
jgi:hypothetical protein